MNKMYILVGVPGCGKSTWVKENLEENTVVVCKDAFRSMLRIDYEFNPLYEILVELLQNAAIAAAVKNGFNIIVDGTNIKKSKRDILKEIVKGLSSDYKIIYVVFKNTDTLNRRMNEPRGYSREKWNAIIQGMIESMEWPEEDECDEYLSFVDIEMGKKLKVPNDEYLSFVDAKMANLFEI